MSAGILVSCSSASKSASSKSKRAHIFDRTEEPAAETTAVPVTPQTVERGVAFPADSILQATPDVSSIDISSLPEGFFDAAKNLPVDSLMGQLAAALPDSLSGLADFLLSVPIDSLAGFIDTLPPGVRAFIPPELLGLLREYAAGDENAVEDVRSLRDSIRRGIPASFRSMLPDSLQGLSDDSLHKFAAAYGIEIPSDLDILTDPDVLLETGALTIIADTVNKKSKPFLEHPVFGKNRDSLVYDVKNRLIFVYGEGDLTYEDNNLKADFMILNTNTKEIYGTGVADTLGKVSRPEFVQAGGNYTMDTITYNLSSGKAKIKGVATKDGEGYLLGRDLKKMEDNTINLAHGKYTTCDRIEHPHFYIAMTKAKVIPGKKIITGPAYFVMEDVPIYFLGIPGGFFPISSGPSSGFIMPTYGEESMRGFYLREGGYYFTFGDYADLKLTGGIYTLGSWEVAAATNYIKRYTFGGNLSINYAKTIYGEKNAADYSNNSNFKIAWSHRQDPKFRPSSQFSASVNFSTAGYSKQGTTNLNDLLNTQTNSSISYAKSWMAGTTAINLTASFSHSQNSRDSTIALTLPNISFSVGSFAPFKRKVAAGKQRWYEKITLSYSMAASNSVSAKEYDLFTNKTLREMMNGVSHKIPIKTSFNFFGFITFSPSINYNENWFFKKVRKEWDPVQRKVITLDPDFGFFRMYNYNASGSFSTKIYGMFQVKRKPGKTGWLQAVRHVITPTLGFTLAPDFTKPQYGFVEYYQSDSTAYQFTENRNLYVGSQSMSPAGPNASLNFSLSNQIEMKVASKRDTSGVKKIPVIEQLSFSGSYNFLLDSMNLSNISVTLRTGNIFKNFGIQLSATWDPYMYVPTANGGAKRIGKYNIGNGKFGRITSTSWSFGYTFNPSSSSQPAMNDINSGGYIGAYANPFDMETEMEPSLRRQYMVSSYYDFSIPWNFGFNYSVNYSYTGLKPVITQTLGFNGSVTLTQKLGFTFTGGYDIARRRLSPMSVNLTRDLHCWTMTFQWVPIGTLKSWQFHIGVKSSMLADLKYDKTSSRYDNLQQ